MRANFKDRRSRDHKLKHQKNIKNAILGLKIY